MRPQSVPLESRDPEPNGRRTLTHRWKGLSDDDVAPALVFLALATLACLSAVTNDTFWHLRSGQQMWQTRGFLTVEPFSYTSAGLELHNHWWLSQALFYAAYAFGGSFLLTAFAGACALAATFLSWRLFRGPWDVRFLLLLWLAALVLPSFGIRPSVVSMLFVALTAGIIARNRLLWLPILFVVWANAHALVILGMAMTAGLVIEAMLWSRAELGRSLRILCALCAAAPTLSPLCVSYWPQVLTTVTLSRSLDLEEYRRALQPVDLPFWAAVVALVALLAVRWSKMSGLPRPERALVMAALILAVAGIMAARNISMFALVGIPALSWLVSVGSTVRAGARRPASTGAYVCLVAGALGAVALVVQLWRFRDWQTAPGADRWKPLSADIVEAVRRCPDPIFNRYDDGGFLMWVLPERKVFVDSRIEAYSAEHLQQSRAADVEGAYAEPFAQYGINCALVGTVSPMYRRLRNDPAFEPAYVDATRAVFVRRDRKNRSSH